MFKTADGNFQVEVGRRGYSYVFSMNTFSHLRSDTDHQFLYCITIYNNLSIKLKELLLTESDLLVLLDNLDAILEGIIDETYVYFGCNNTTMISNVIYINKFFSIDNGILDTEHITFTIYDYINELMNKLFTLDMTDCIEEFSNEIYKVLYIDENQKCCKILQA